MSLLPQGWADTEFGKITINFDGKRVPVKASERAKRQGPYRYFGAQGVIDYIDDYIFDGTYLLIAEDGANLASRAQPIAQISDGKFWVNNHAHIVRSADGVSLRYLMHFMNGNPLNGSIRGTAQPKLTQADLNKLRVPLPSIAEQDRVVASIEEQFSRLDAGLGLLGHSASSLKRMRLSILQDAATTALSRADGITIPIANLLSAPLANGKSLPDGPKDGFPVLRLSALRQGKVDVSFYKNGAWGADEAAPFRIHSGDYLVARGNGSRNLVGRGGMVEMDADVTYPDTMIRIRFNETVILPDYAALIWDSGMVRTQIEKAARTTAGIYKINQKDLGQIRIPVPALKDQSRIKEFAIEALDSITSLESFIATQAKRGKRLRSSILEAAFSGKLI